MKTLFLLIFIFFSMINYQSIILENQKTLFFFIEQLLPSLFVLCVLIQMIPFPSKIKSSRFLHKIFHLDTSSFLIILKSILLGNPAGSYMIDSLLKEHIITKAQTQRLIYAVSLPSISFMLMTLPFMTSQKTALQLFFIQLVTIFILLLLTRKTEIKLTCSFEKVSLYQAVSFSIRTMALILAYLFILSAIKTLLIIYFPQSEILIQLMSEFSSGCAYFAHHQQAAFYLLICIGFGGFASHLQILGGCKESDLYYPDYLKFRIFQVLISLFIYTVMIILINF